MRVRRRIMAGLTVVGALMVLVASAGPAPALSRLPAPASAPAVASPGELIYVANANAGPVTAYPSGSRGAVAPTRTVLAPNDPNAVWDPWGVTFDASSHLFVQTFLSDATTVVFAPGAHGVTAPLRKFMGIGPDNRSIAVDSNGFEYVAGSDQPTMVVVEPPGAHGRPADLYNVPPVRTIQLDEAWNPWPSDLAVDAQNELLAVTSRPQGNAIEIFAGGAHGGSTPVRVISGPRTGLGSCGSVCDLAIAFSSLTGRIYVAVSDGQHTHISVFASTASGNAAPVRTIEGSLTGLAGTSVTGISGSQCDGTIYAMVHTSPTGFGPARVYAYARLANGNVHPLRSFTDGRSHFGDGQGLTVTACGRLPRPISCAGRIRGGQTPARGSSATGRAIARFRIA